MRDLAVYGLLRLGLWLGLWYLLALIGIGPLLAGILAALIAMMISILFLRRPRDAVAARWQAADERRRSRRSESERDAEEEDALLGDDARARQERADDEPR